jgi:predicted transposase YbfD/YdcC
LKEMEKTTRSLRCYLSSARLSAQACAKAACAHWTIENGLHWILDTAFDEDRSRARKDRAAENLAMIRKRALNILKTAIGLIPTFASHRNKPASKCRNPKNH